MSLRKRNDWVFWNIDDFACCVRIAFSRHKPSYISIICASLPNECCLNKYSKKYCRYSVLQFLHTNACFNYLFHFFHHGQYCRQFLVSNRSFLFIDLLFCRNWVTSLSDWFIMVVICLIRNISITAYFKITQ